MIASHTKYYQGDKVEERQVRRKCDKTRGGGGVNCLQGFVVGNLI